MKTAFRIRVLRFSSAAVAVLASATAYAQPISPITIIDGGYSEYCSLAAHNPEHLPNVLITGTRLPLSPIRVCTLAIEAGTERVNRAANHNNRGVLHFETGNLDAALADFEEAIRRDERLVFAHINRGNIFIRREQWEQAISAFDRAIELGIDPEADRLVEVAESDEPGEGAAIPEMARVHFNRGIAHEYLEQLREAYLDYRRASELAPDWDVPRQEMDRFEVVR
ncbi:MAG: tetratricopeptide repeat protein [Pseudohongiellaceae bacterium]